MDRGSTSSRPAAVLRCDDNLPDIQLRFHNLALAPVRYRPATEPDLYADLPVAPVLTESCACDACANGSGTTPMAGMAAARRDRGTRATVGNHLNTGISPS